MRRNIVKFVEKMGDALGTEFKPFVPELLPYLMEVLERDDSLDRSVTERVLEAFRVCAGALEEHLHLIVPPIVHLFEMDTAPLGVRRSAIDTLNHFALTMSLAPYGPRILHAYCMAVDGSELRAPLERLLLVTVSQMGCRALVFTTTIRATLNRLRITVSAYDQLVSAIEHVRAAL